jgi:hypothetical protein
MRRRVGSVEVVLFTSSRSKIICAATLGWALTCNKRETYNHIFLLLFGGLFFINGGNYKIPMVFFSLFNFNSRTFKTYNKPP